MLRYYIFCICLLRIITIVNSYTPPGRAQHTASYVDNKIYFLGGSTSVEEKYTNGFFYLDVSKPFTLNSDLPIVDLSNNTLIYKHAYAMSAVCGSNKDTIFLFGGEFEDDTVASIFAYNTSKSNPAWFSVNVNNVPKPTRRRLTTGVCDKNAMLYSFGGSIIDNVGVTTFSNDFDIFDTNYNPLNWSSGSRLNIPPLMDTATATLLTDGRIVYLGGNTATEPNYIFIGLSEIYIYDTNNGEWSKMVTIGDTPIARVGHTAVLTQDGRIIVYGGILEDVTPAPNKLLVLNTTVQPFEWSISNSNIPISAPFWRHTATLVGNYMIVAFGHANDNNNYFSDQIHMLDVNNYNWVTEFTPTNNPNPNPDPSPSSNPNPNPDPSPSSNPNPNPDPSPSSNPNPNPDPSPSPSPSDPSPSPNLNHPVLSQPAIIITICSILVIVISISIIFLCRRNSRNLEIRQHQFQVIEEI